MATIWRHQRKRPITAEDLFALHLVSDPQPSPDGSRIACVVTRLDQASDDYHAAIWLVPTTGGPPVQLTAGAARDREPRWSPDGRTIAFLSNRPADVPPPVHKPDSETGSSEPAKKTEPEKKPTQIWLIRADGGEATQLTCQPHGVSALAWSPDGREIAFVSPADAANEPDSAAAPAPAADERIVTQIRYRFDGRGFIEQRSHLWTIPVDGGEARQLTFGDMDDAEPAWSPDGRVIAFTSNRSPGRELNNVSAIYTVPARGGEVRCLTEGDVAFAAPAWSPDGTRLAFTGHLEPSGSSARNVQVWTIAATGGTPVDHTSQWDRACGDTGMSDVFVAAEQRPVWSADGNELYTLVSERGATQVYRVDLRAGEMIQITSGPRRVSAVRRAGDDRLVYTVGTASRPFELFTAKLDGSDERPLNEHNRAWLDEVQLSEAEEIHYTSPVDGQELQGWVLKPPGFRPDAAVRYPMIVEIHGGPHAMYGQAMFHEMQLMAARGYIVLLTNPRGSSGYGEDFLRAALANWGEADMPDVMAGVDAVLARGYVDEQRLGVTGGSYGGYLTNWVIGHSDRFRAAVTQRCVSNFVSFYGTSDIGFDFGEQEFAGMPWRDADQLRKHSPLTYVEQMTTPLLIIHSERDLRCPIEQAEQLFVSLKRLGREVIFVRVPEETHDLSRTGKPSRRLARLHHLLAWFDQHL